MSIIKMFFFIEGFPNGNESVLNVQNAIMTIILDLCKSILSALTLLPSCTVSASHLAGVVEGA